MKLIVGLGNIGEKYKDTRHNCGFMLLDRFAKNLENNVWKEDKKQKAIIIKSEFDDKNIILAKPTTLMNLSGEAIQKIMNFYKIDLKDLIVIYDDIDLDLGSIRIRDKGSAGTHNGMKSIIQTLNNQNFTRIRIGIESRGELSPEKIDISAFVLSKFNEKEMPILEKSLENGIQELKRLILT